MKKVYGFLIILLALSLLDGTPIHRHHGKFIASKSRTALNENDLIAQATEFNHSAVVDDDSDDEKVTHQGFTIIINPQPHFNKTLATPDARLTKNTAPLYKRICHYRI